MYTKHTKKAQSEIITTILIILLVLAAVVIVWQVIQSTVTKGAEEIESQSQCIGLRMEITNLVVGGPGIGKVTIRPSKDIDGYRIYNGIASFSSGTENATLNALDQVEVMGVINSGDEIEVIGRIGETWCPGTKQKA